MVLSDACDILAEGGVAWDKAHAQEYNLCILQSISLKDIRPF